MRTAYLTSRTFCASFATVALVTVPLVAAGDGKHSPLSAQDKAALLSSFDKVMSCEVECGEACMSAGECTSECTAAHELRATLSAKLVKSEAARAAILPALEEKWSAPSTKLPVKQRILDFLAEASCDEGRALCANLFEKEPAVFTADHRLAFAMGGSETFVKAISQSFEQVACPREKLLYAAFLAGKGCKSGQTVLETALQQACAEEGGIARAFIAANGLQKLGAKVCTVELAQRAHGQALAALDAGDVATARRIALETSFGQESIQGQWVYLPYFEQRLQWTLGAGARKYANADQVFQLLESIGRAN